METGHRDHVAFYLTGKRPGKGLEPIDNLDLRPALLAGYRDLTKLRYDFPLVLVDDSPADHSCVRSLSAIIDDVVQEIAQGDDGDRLTRHAMRIEQDMRASIAAGASGSLSSLWDESAQRLTAQGDDRLNDSLARASAALKVDGSVVDCGTAAPAQLLRHVWSVVQDSKSNSARDEIDRLIIKLSDILKVDFDHSEAGRSAESLKATVGAVHAEMFDFDAMSRLLGKSSSGTTLPEIRRKRIEQLLAVLKSQRFFGKPASNATAEGGVATHSFVFQDCTSALLAYRQRMPEAIALSKAIAIAELEIDAQYDESKHDELFAEFGAGGLDIREMARFPDYLVLVDSAQLHGGEHDTLMEILSAGLPMKVLVQTDDILDVSGIDSDAHLSFGLHSRQLANTAIGFNDVYVLQASCSHLYQFRDRILSGLSGAGPAVFSVFSGANGNPGGLPAYLIAAAAMESRAFPAFTYDPAAGDNWATRFYFDANPQVDLDWPVQSFAYEDENHQRIQTNTAFTLVDFVACDHRFAKHFANVPRETWNGSMVPITDCLGHEVNGMPEKIPSILMVDSQNLLQKVIVDDKLIGATKRCRDAWHSFQELGGIHNSHAERLLARERKEWEAREVQSATATLPPPVSAPKNTVAEVAPAPDVTLDEPELAQSPDDAYVETARCTSCNECTLINNKMFAYDENKQCHIADLDAGTYRELVEAAENCQVAIIHPGKPWNMNEPGIEELMERAAAFQ